MGNQFILKFMLFGLFGKVSIWCDPQVAVEVKEGRGCVPEVELKALPWFHRALVKCALMAEVLRLLGLVIQHEPELTTGVSSHLGANPLPLTCGVPREPVQLTNENERKKENKCT